MRRVTLVCLNFPPEPTGIAPYSGGLAEGLADLGWEVDVVAGMPHYPQWRLQEGSEPGRSHLRTGLRLLRRRHPVPATPRIWNRLLMEVVFGLKAVAAPWGRPDVVVLITPALFSSVLAACRALLQRKPYVVWVQDIYSSGISETGTAGRWTGRLLGLVEGLLMSRAEAVVAIHERFRSTLLRELKIPASRISVIRNWSHLDLEEYTDPKVLRKEFGWPDDVCVVLHAGNMGAKQGLENVVAASHLAAERQERLLFVLMGDGNRRADLESLGGNACLEFRDPLPAEQFLDALRAADVLLVNERADLSEMAVPSKLTSYFASGQPVVAATDGRSVTAQEIELSGGGVRVDADEPEQLLTAVLELSRDPELARAIGERGLAFGRAQLTPESALTRFDSVLTTSSGRSSAANG